MSERTRNNLIKYGISGVGCLVYAAIHCFTRDIMEMSGADLYRTVADGFTVPGLLCVFFGAIVWLSNEGAFNGVSYVLKFAARALLFLGARGPVESYGDFVESRKKKPVTGYGFLFLTGLICLAVAGVFIALFYSVA